MKSLLLKTQETSMLLSRRRYKYRSLLGTTSQTCIKVLPIFRLQQTVQGEMHFGDFEIIHYIYHVSRGVTWHRHDNFSRLFGDALWPGWHRSYNCYWDSLFYSDTSHQNIWICKWIQCFSIGCSKENMPMALVYDLMKSRCREIPV